MHLRIFVVFLFATLTSFSLAQGEIRQSENWLVRSAQHRSLDSLKEKLGYPDPPIDKGIVVLVTGGGGTSNVLVVGPIKGDARKYAEALNAWQATFGGREPVEFSQEDDCAAAGLDISSARFFAVHAETRLDLSGLKARLQPLGAPLRLALRVPKHVATTGLEKPAYETVAAKVYDFEGPTAPKVILSVSLPPSLPVLFWLFVAFVPVCCFAGLGFAAFVGARSAIPLEKRRKLYSKLALYPTFGSIALHMPFALWMISSRALTPVADVWMGTTSASAALIPFVMLPLPFVMIVALFMGKLEKRLFGATEGEAAVIPPPPEPDEATKASRKRVMILSFVFIGIGAVIWMGSTFALSPKTEWRPLFKLPGLFLMALSPYLAKFLLRGEVKKYEGDLEDPGLEAMARRLGDQVGVPVRSLRISRDPSMNGAPSATMNRKGEVRLTDRARQVMDPVEIEFLIARALVGEKLGHERIRRRSMLPILLVPLPFFYLSLRMLNPGLPRIPFGAIMVVPFAVMIYIFFFGNGLTKRQELEKDKAALEVTGNLAAAEAALWKLKLSSPLPHAEESNFLSKNPDLAKRLAALRTV